MRHARLWLQTCDNFDALGSTSEMTSRRNLLVFALGIIGGALILALSFVLLGSLKPSDRARLASTIEIDVSSIEPGELIRIAAPQGEILVLRRTSEQMSWLQESDKAAQLVDQGNADAAAQRIGPEHTDLFVAVVERFGDSWLLLDGRASGITCDEFDYTDEPIKTRGEVLVTGAFYCAKFPGSQQADLSLSPYVYDVAGRPSVEWVQPLRVPRHRFRGTTLQVLP